ncbi:hypothetical protein MUK42_34107 [Musa troglodytarum]|uniref:Uncharacterized protein n=1 Tax=Musa troglodytarum TaxID=320322 RepID=A0A9E7KGW2_9LILI|nr:hypothetical protein MUK42_34107 [Musa troglodytarum]
MLVILVLVPQGFLVIQIVFTLEMKICWFVTRQLQPTMCSQPWAIHLVHLILACDAASTKHPAKRTCMHHPPHQALHKEFYGTIKIKNGTGLVDRPQETEEEDDDDDPPSTPIGRSEGGAWGARCRCGTRARSTGGRTASREKTIVKEMLDSVRSPEKKMVRDEPGRCRVSAATAATCGRTDEDRCR